MDSWSNLKLIYRCTGNAPSDPYYCEVDKLLFELFSRNNVSLKLISVGDTEEHHPFMDNVDPGLLVKRCGLKVATSVQGDRLQFTAQEIEDDELLGGEDEEEENEDINQYLNNISAVKTSTAQQATSSQPATFSSPKKPLFLSRSKLHLPPNEQHLLPPNKQHLLPPNKRHLLPPTSHIFPSTIYIFPATIYIFSTTSTSWSSPAIFLTSPMQ